MTFGDEELFKKGKDLRILFVEQFRYLIRSEKGQGYWCNHPQWPRGGGEPQKHLEY
jgi:hypothetical protein